MNNNKTLDNMLWVFLPKVAQMIGEKKNLSLDKVNNFIYNSKTYEILETPSCKLWYFSNKDLTELFINEYEGKKIFGEEYGK